MKKKAVILIIIGIISIGFGLTLNYNNKSQIDKSTQSANDVQNQKTYNEFIKKKFTTKYFTIRKLSATDKQSADFQIEYDIKKNSGKFNLRTRWIKEYNSEFITITNYKKYLENNSDPLYEIVGIAGEPQKPELLYIIPVNEKYTDETLMEGFFS